MITLTAKIDLISSTDDTLYSVSSNLSGNNVSSEIGAILNAKPHPTTAFIIGVSKVGDGSTYESSVPYYIGEQVARENGLFRTPYRFDILGNKLNTITIDFDKTFNRHPNSILVGGEQVTATQTITTTTDDNEIISGYYYTTFVYKTNVCVDTVTILDDTTQFDHPIDISIIKDTIYITTYYATPNATVSLNIQYVGYEEISEVFDDDSTFTISGLNERNNISLIIDNWNTPNAPLVISSIYVKRTYEIDYRNLLSISGKIFDRGSEKTPDYGIISNTGNIEFNDYNGEIGDYADNGLLISDLQVTIKLKNTLNGKEQTLAIMKTDTWNYDSSNKTVSVSLKDDLEELQDINFDGLEYDARNPYKIITNGTMEKFYDGLVGETPGKYNMVSVPNLDEETQNILRNTKIKYPFLKSGNLWAQFNKICQVCGLYIYKDIRKDGRGNEISATVCSYTYGS